MLKQVGTFEYGGAGSFLAYLRSTLLNLLRKPRIQVVIGQPFTVEKVRRPSEQQVSELTERIFTEITALLPAKYLPAYTDPGKDGNAADGGDPAGI